VILTQQDVSRLHEAAALIADVMYAHNHNITTLGDLPLSITSLLGQAIQDTRIAEKCMEACCEYR
jgi:hypothetical protein